MMSEMDTTNIKRWVVDYVDDVDAWRTAASDVADNTTPEAVKSSIRQAFDNAEPKGTPRFLSDGLYVSPTSLGKVENNSFTRFDFLGLFCMFDIKKGTVIGRYEGSVTNMADYDQYLKSIPKRLKVRKEQYLFGVNHDGVDYVIDPLDMKGDIKYTHALAFANEPPPGSNSNVVAIPKDRDVYFVSCTNIPAHRELTLYYGWDRLDPDYKNNYEIGNACTFESNPNIDRMPKLLDFLQSSQTRHEIDLRQPMDFDLASLTVDSDPENSAPPFGLKRKSDITMRNYVGKKKQVFTL